MLWPLRQPLCCNVAAAADEICSSRYFATERLTEGPQHHVGHTGRRLGCLSLDPLHVTKKSECFWSFLVPKTVFMLFFYSTLAGNGGHDDDPH